MKLIIGLGNPGEKYITTRHNAGFVVVEEVAKRLGVEADWKEEKKFGAEMARSGEWLLVKPMKFMNRSGEVVSKVVNFYKVEMENLVVAHDDLDIVLGEFKLVRGVGPKVHNGVSSVERELGETDFWRLRMGVDGRDGDRRMSGEDYVLGKFGKDEKKILDEEVKRAVDELLTTMG